MSPSTAQKSTTSKRTAAGPPSMTPTSQSAGKKLKSSDTTPTELKKLDVTKRKLSDPLQPDPEFKKAIMDMKPQRYANRDEERRYAPLPKKNRIGNVADACHQERQRQEKLYAEERKRMELED